MRLILYYLYKLYFLLYEQHIAQMNSKKPACQTTDRSERGSNK
jgi:hypothetical protein